MNARWNIFLMSFSHRTVQTSWLYYTCEWWGGSEKPAAVEIAIVSFQDSHLNWCIAILGRVGPWNLFVTIAVAQDGRLLPPMMAIPTSVFRRQRTFFFGENGLISFCYDLKIFRKTLHFHQWPCQVYYYCRALGQVPCNGVDPKDKVLQILERRHLQFTLYVPSKKVSTYHINRLSWKNRTILQYSRQLVERKDAGSERSSGIDLPQKMRRIPSCTWHPIFHCIPFVIQKKSIVEGFTECWKKDFSMF